MSSHFKWICALLATVTALASCATTPQQGDVRTVIEASNAKWEQALSRGDAAGIAALYTETGQLFPPNDKVVTGRAAIQEYWQGAIQAGFKAVTLSTMEVESCGDSAYEIGRFTVPGEGGEVLDTGDYIVIWKRENGQWKLHRDMWTTNSPAGGQ